MSKRVYISADYSENNGDRDVVDIITNWSYDNYHKVDFTDTAAVKKGSVADNPDCRICDLKREFNSQINASSAVIFVVGDQTASRTAGSACLRVSKNQTECYCTPYKQNINGQKPCTVATTYDVGPDDDVGPINSYSYLKHEFMQAVKRKKKIIIVYNSLNAQTKWLPPYMSGYESIAKPFWIRDALGRRVGNYNFIKQELGYV